MGWRTIIITNRCKLSYKNNYLIIRNDNLQMIHLSEINLIVIDTGMVSITSFLINELSNNKIKMIICDEKHNPACEFVPYYGNFNTSKKILSQVKWNNTSKDETWSKIVKNKIYNQAILLKKYNFEKYDKVLRYVDEVKIGDKTNREGHAAKVYFNILFGNKFIRGTKDNINCALDYGYSILLSVFNKEIVSKGYITQLGINHKNEFNYFNLSCDLMEPFRPLIDEIVYNNIEKEFDNNYKYKLIDVMNNKINMDGKEYFLSNAIPIYIKNVIDVIEENQKEIINYEL